MTPTELDLLSINTIRTLAIDAVEKAKSGHPGLPMGAAPMAYVLWTKFLKHNPHNPQWLNRDRFILSAGHGSMLLYALLHLTGYDLSLDELKHFRQLGSKTPGHPEYGHTPGVETTTGPLGQGFATGVGMAMAERYLAARYNRPDFPIIDHYTYAIVSDGDLMEGISSEAGSLAGHLKLNKLIYLYDDNHISIEGSTDIAFSENVLERFDAYGWYTDRVEDGTDVNAIEQAIKRAQQQDRPSLIAVRTHIGYGSPHKQDKASAHGSPLGEDEVKLTKEAYGWPEDKTFYIPDEALKHFREAVPKGEQEEARWNQLFSAYQERFPELARELTQAFDHILPENIFEDLPSFNPGEMIETRAASGKVINAIAPHFPNLIGGSADLGPSNNTTIKDGGDFSAENPSGRNLHFGVREHAMGAALNGMSLHGGLRVYGGTFLIFSDYMKPAIRLSSLMHQPVIYILTHDSIGLGEDGPTHQPIEQLAALRAMPNILVIRPADANETKEAWKVALTTTDKPIALALTRQKVATLPADKTASLRQGGYILAENSPHPELILMATGSEVGIAYAAYEKLAQEGVSVRVVSLPSWELFATQSKDYQDHVLPPHVTKRIAIEAASAFGWERFVGAEGKIIAMTTFGASGKIEDLMEHFGFTTQHIVDEAHQLLHR
ncbi:transketolase [Sulfobacillus thermosulfidooxidans]|uniref:transketolase n=1 Tax=Sulfobacillus thermosulfidooxidans TaxID=28034 RepID=UPI0006B586D8|nr:transketolase [Sulfobacillus thermosulfidooxidans]